MPRLTVRHMNTKVVSKLKQPSGTKGISMRPKLKGIQRDGSPGRRIERLSFKEALLAMPNVGRDSYFLRSKAKARPAKMYLA